MARKWRQPTLLEFPIQPEAENVQDTCPPTATGPEPEADTGDRDRLRPLPACLTLPLPAAPIPLRAFRQPRRMTCDAMRRWSFPLRPRAPDRPFWGLHEERKAKHRTSSLLFGY